MAGQVIGIVGRAGSGKSYLATRIAYRRLRAGGRVATNFTLRLPPSMAGRWQRFSGWSDLANLEDCTVVVDEAHLMAPSYKHLSFPVLARWKLSQVRKFGLDLFWVSQHEDRINRTLRDLTNLIFVCHAWFGSYVFSARAYEPEDVRRRGKHLTTKWYFLRRRIAGLYDTLELLDIDDHLMDEGGELARQIMRRRREGLPAPHLGTSSGPPEERSGASTAVADPSWSQRGADGQDDAVAWVRT